MCLVLPAYTYHSTYTDLIYYIYCPTYPYFHLFVPIRGYLSSSVYSYLYYYFINVQ